MADEFEPPELGPLRDNSVLWRVCMWGGAATVAVAAALLITQTDIGSGRLVEALAQPRTAGPQVAANDDLLKRVEAQRVEETRHLEARIRELAADRERLSARLASLEQNFTDITGSIKRDLAIVAATAPNAKPVQEVRPAAPVLSPPPTATPADSQSAAPKAETRIDNKIEAKPEAKVEPKPEPKADAKPQAKVETPAEPKPEAKADVKAETPAAKTDAAEAAAGDKPAAVPMPPARVAALSPQATETATDAARKSQLGVEIGGARSMEILNARWAAVKANFGPLIEGLSPLVRHDNRPGIIPYRLIVGPLPNGAAAAELCARLHASKVACRTTPFTGDKFAHQ
jgi:outer membrane biosynthesis protein TonB